MNNGTFLHQQHLQVGQNVFPVNFVLSEFFAVSAVPRLETIALFLQTENNTHRYFALQVKTTRAYPMTSLRNLKPIIPEL